MRSPDNPRCRRQDGHERGQRHDRLRRRGSRVRGDLGESLVEIVITVVIIGITVTALLSGLGSAAAAANAHKVGVQADTAMRNYAEAVKSAVRGCSEGQSFTPDFSPAAGFRVSMSPDDTSCPSAKEARRLDLTVDSPTGTRQVLTIVVRTP